MEKQASLTADDLWQLREDGVRYELDDGELITMAPASLLQGIVAGNIAHYLKLYAIKNDAGVVLVSEAGFKLQSNPDKVRAPDVAFITRDRLPANLEGYGELAPDLAVEIISPNEYAVDVDEKTRQYLQAGTKQVWLVYPRSKSISVYTSLRDVTIYTQEDDLSGGDVLPGFACKVADIFAIGE
jgi:Uma2 family endonuclease